MITDEDLLHLFCQGRTGRFNSWADPATGLCDRNPRHDLLHDPASPASHPSLLSDDYVRCDVDSIERLANEFMRLEDSVDASLNRDMEIFRRYYGWGDGFYATNFQDNRRRREGPYRAAMPLPRTSSMLRVLFELMTYFPNHASNSYGHEFDGSSSDPGLVQLFALADQTATMPVPRAVLRRIGGERVAHMRGASRNLFRTAMAKRSALISSAKLRRVGDAPMTVSARGGADPATAADFSAAAQAIHLPLHIISDFVGPSLSTLLDPSSTTFTRIETAVDAIWAGHVAAHPGWTGAETIAFAASFVPLVQALDAVARECTDTDEINDAIPHEVYLWIIGLMRHHGIERLVGSELLKIGRRH